MPHFSSSYECIAKCLEKYVDPLGGFSTVVNIHLLFINLTRQSYITPKKHISCLLTIHIFCGFRQAFKYVKSPQGQFSPLRIVQITSRPTFNMRAPWAIPFISLPFTGQVQGNRKKREHKQELKQYFLLLCCVLMLFLYIIPYGY